MDLGIALAAGLLAAVGGVAAGHWQHLLYSNADHRVRGHGPGYIARAVFLAAGCGVATALALRPGHYDSGPALLTALFCCALVVLSSTDFERRLLPNRLMYPSMLLAALLCWAWPDRSIAAIWIGAGVAFAAGAGLFAIGMFMGAARGIAATPFGLGDVKLIILLGLLTGWPAFGSAIVFGVILAGVPALLLVLLGRGRSVFSYGPYLAAGGAIVLLFPASFV